MLDTDRKARDIAKCVNTFVAHANQAEIDCGWRHDPKTGEPLKLDVPLKLCLIHSEISEALEGHRRGNMDEHLPHRSALEVELSDGMIRMAALAGELGFDLGGAVAEKMAFNAVRPDHKPENRQGPGGKAY